MRIFHLSIERMRFFRFIKVPFDLPAVVEEKADEVKKEEE